MKYKIHYTPELLELVVISTYIQTDRHQLRVCFMYATTIQLLIKPIAHKSQY